MREIRNVVRTAKTQQKKKTRELKASTKDRDVKKKNKEQKRDEIGSVLCSRKSTYVRAAFVFVGQQS